MRPTGPGENRPLRPPQGQRRRATSRLPPSAWQADAAPWRANIHHNGHRRPVAVRRNSGVLRGLSGSLAAGLTVFALGLVGVQIWQSQQGEPGPEWSVVTGHLVAAALALVCQRFADRRRDTLGTLAAVAVFGIVVVTLWIFWFV